MQGASLLKKDRQLARKLVGYYHSSPWLFPAEDTALIWEIPEGTVIPTNLRLRENCGPDCIEGPFALQPKRPMPFNALVNEIRDFQYLKAIGRSTPGNRLIRLQDWMTPDNPFVKAFPEIVEGRWTSLMDK
ncbi:MAG: hypothetical protein Q9213_000482 [Squamulea squamosa]